MNEEQAKELDDEIEVWDKWVCVLVCPNCGFGSLERPAFCPSCGKKTKFKKKMFRKTMKDIEEKVSGIWGNLTTRTMHEYKIEISDITNAGPKNVRVVSREVLKPSNEGFY